MPDKELIRVIVADDEPIGADDLSDLILKTYGTRIGVKVRTAYNARTVLQLVESEPCDLLITDIQMPGMTGLELSQRLRERFPELSVLFLTGFDDFNYAYEALRQNADSYLLKTESDEIILKTIGDIMLRIQERREMANRMQEAESRYNLMLPVYRRQLLTQALTGTVTANALEHANEALSGKLYMIVSPLETQSDAQANGPALHTAVSRTLTAALEDAMLWLEEIPLDRELVWIAAMQGKIIYTDILLRLARKAGDSIKGSHGEVPIFAVSEGPVELDHLREVRTLLTSTAIRQAREEKASAAISRSKRISPSRKEAQRISQLRRQLGVCQQDIQEEDFHALRADAQPILQYFQLFPPKSDPFAAELWSSMNSALLSYMNRNGLSELIYETERYGEQGVARLLRIIKILEDTHPQTADYATKSITRYVTDYIHNHLSEDISTATLAKRSGYSVGYLSRVFKSEEGIGIHEYVLNARIELARDLLRNTNLLVYEVASSCGYDNTAYFIKVFKANTGMTPQEYRKDVARPGEKNDDQV